MTLHTYTFCGLHVDFGTDPRRWSSFQYVQAATDGDAAYDEVMAGVRSMDFALATVHLGEHAAIAGFTYADMDFDFDAEERAARRLHLPEQAFMICGIQEGTWETIQLVQNARTPRLAYREAFNYTSEAYRQVLLLASVHYGVTTSLEVPAAVPGAANSHLIRERFGLLTA